MRMELSEWMVFLYRESQLYLTWGFVLYYGTVLFLLWQFYKMVIKPLLNPLLKQLPHRPFTPVVGNFVEIVREEAITPYTRWMAETDSSIIVYHGLFGSVRVMVADPGLMKHVLVTNAKNYHKPEFAFSRIREIIGNGLVLSEGQFHATHRKLCNGSFRTSILQNFVPVVEKYAKEMCDMWVNQVEENLGQDYTEIKPTELLSRMTLDAIGEVGFGHRFNSLVDPEAEDVLAFQHMLGVFGFSWKMLIPFFSKVPTAEKRKWDSDMAVINSCVSTVIGNKKKLLSTILDDEHVSDLLTSLLMAKDEGTGVGLSKQDVRDEVLTFMVAGHETTSTALQWCLLALARHPEVQERLRSEVQTIEGSLTWDKVEQLPYLNAFVKETLRLHPPVSLTFREAQNPDRYGDLIIPQGTIINICIGGVHRNPKYWDDPSTFRPERFLNNASVTPYTYLPFIAGPRMCIGYKFALMEIKVATATLLRKLQFHPIPGKTYRNKQRITMRPSPDLELRMSKVK